MRTPLIAARRSVLVVLVALLMPTPERPVQGQTPTPLAATPRKDEWWTNLHKSFLDRAKKGDVDLLFLGDSITQGWGDNATWKTHYTPRHAANFGIGGDGTQHVLWRVENGELDGIKPRAIVMMIGTNNIGSSKPEDIADVIVFLASDAARWVNGHALPVDGGITGAVATGVVPKPEI